MRNVIYIILMGLLISCENIQVGYLFTENAVYNPDVLEIKKELDITPPHEGLVENPDYRRWIDLGYDHDLVIQYYPQFIPGIVQGEDYDRFEQKIPWVSYQLQGLEGTRPIFYEIAGATEINGGDVSELLAKARARGDGAIEVELENEIPVGEYLIDLKVSNEGHSKVLPGILKIVVK